MFMTIIVRIGQTVLNEVLKNVGIYVSIIFIS